MSLISLENRIHKAFSRLGSEPTNWIPQTPSVDYDVAVIGAGQSGVAISAGLRKAGIRNTVTLDLSDAEAAGMWESKSYMRTLRTPKSNTGPELGIPELTYRAWYEAQFGAAPYQHLNLIDRNSWHRYLRWLRRMLDVVVEYGARLLSVSGAGKYLDLLVENAAGRRTLRVRKLVLATGIDGSGVPDVPEAFRRNLSPDRYAHSYSVLDPAKVAAARVAILGAGSSAFDAAAFALENGAAEVELFCRQEDLARSTSLRSTAYPAIEHFHLLPDADRWRIARMIKARGSVPTTESIARATAFPNFKIHLGAPWEIIAQTGDEITAETPIGRFAFDYAISATGFRIDPVLRPELAEFAEKVVTWQDRFIPSADESSASLGRYPYLGAGYQLSTHDPDSDPYVGNIHCFNAAALPSCGRHLGDVASLRHAVPRLIQAIADDLFRDDYTHHVSRFGAPPPDDLTGDEYRHAVKT
ncbi:MULTISPECIES: SidA/IucD/PvdA family monooxygenase [Rhizobium/Agrobacterium group]|nr:MULTISPECIES: SidA/IucD/PvdA family monooxygenase [Rhizobium/Agrobacterium group]NTF97803.1 NAD(P)/FAD-dependent oxidoreductase [Rhizobium rhizogenes]